MKNERQFISEFFIPFLQDSGFKNIKQEVRASDTGFDLCAEKNNKQVLFEIKYTREYGGYSNAAIAAQIKRMRELVNRTDSKYFYYLIYICEINEAFKEHSEQINILDINDIYYLCQNNQNLKNKLLSNIYYILNKKSDRNYNDAFFAQLKPDGLSDGDVLKKQLNQCNDSNGQEFEQICEKIIRFLFSEDLKLFKKQEEVNDDLFRLDMICAIKDSPNHFWEIIRKYYNSEYIVFEFKNYKNGVDQNLIYITEKYLYSAALRNVAIIVSKNGFKENIMQIVQGVLREHSKLILLLDKDDLIKMINMKENSLAPSNYLLDKLEEFLIKLSK